MDAFSQISVLIGLAAFFGLIAHKLKQPLILGYIAAGVLLQVTNVFGEVDVHNLELFSKIGIVFLLFILGLDLDLKELKNTGKVAFATGIGQITFTVILGVLIAFGMGYDFVPALFIAIALTFSSTIVIVKLLSHKRDLDTLYGKISVGFLLVQDFVAIIMLILLSSSVGGDSGNNLLVESGLFVVKATGAFLLLYFIDKFILPWLIKLSGHDREILFITMIAWSLVFAALVASSVFGLSVEVGALAAGIALSTRKESLQIESWTRPLRDFFLTVFFVLLGFQIQISAVDDLLIPSLIFSFFVLIGNPLIVMFILSLMKYPSKVGFFAGLTVAQISEFSLLVAALGVAQGHLTERDITLLTLVGGITMTLSSYMILYNEKIYDLLKPILGIFDLNGDTRTNYSRKRTSGRILIFGFNRMASQVHDLVENSKKKFLVIDNDAKKIDEAEELGATVVFGDLKDDDLLTKLKLEKSDLIVSTVPELSANENLLIHIADEDMNIPVIVTAMSRKDAMKLYELGADYVLQPYLTASIKLARIIQKDDIDSYLNRISKREIGILKRTFSDQ